MPPATRSITLRISVLFSVLAALVLCVMGYVIRVSVEHHFHEQDRLALEGKLALIQNILDEENGRNTLGHFRKKLTDALVGHHELSVMVADVGGKTLFKNGHADFPADLIQNAKRYVLREPLKLEEIHHQGNTYRGTVVRLESNPPGTSYIVLIATNVQHHADFLMAFETQLLLVGCIGLLLMVAMGWIATRRGLRPIWRMAHVAEGISAQRLDGRLELHKLPFELRSLGTSFNEMLDRLGDSLNRLSDFSSDIAHELRTPISNLMMQTQVSLSKLRSADDYREILYSNMEEYERLARMISDMLFLAKADNGLVIPLVETVNLRGEIEALFEYYDALAAEKEITLQVEGDACVNGDRLMIRRALSNLLSNAIRHSRAQTSINVVVEERTAGTFLFVSNQGDTISADQLPRIFDRFYRADASRRRVDEGAGLGLAITQSIIQAHQGQISVTSEQGRTVFEVMLPTLENPMRASVVAA